MTRHLLLALALLSGCAPRAGAAPGWIRSTPGAGGAFTQASATGDTVWVAADIAGFYRTFDGGKSWTAMGLATPVSGAAVAVKPGDGRRVVAGTEGSAGNPFWVSSNAADAVPKWTSPKADAGWLNFITWGIGRRVWAVGRSAYGKAGTARLWASSDDGASWRTAGTAGLDATACPLKIVCHPTNDDVLYLISGRDKFKSDGRKALFKSTDEGGHWKEIGADVLSGTIQDMALDPGSPNTLYATTGDLGTDKDQVFRSTDGGATWAPIGRKHTGNVVIVRGRTRLINVERPSSWDKCGAASECGTWEWDGAKWTHLSDTSNWDTGWAGSVAWTFGQNIYGRCKTVSQDPLHPERLWWVTSRFVLQSSDGGATFSSAAFTRRVADGVFSGRGVENVSVMSLDGHGPNVLAGYYDSGLWLRTRPGDEGWQPLNDKAATGKWEGAGGNVSTCLSLADRGHTKMWVANGENRDHHTLLWSEQGGQSWQRATGIPASVFISGLSYDPHSTPGGLTMFVTAGGYVYKSTDDGHNWKKCEPGPYRVYFTAVDPSEGRRVYAGGRSGIWFSEDGGATWSQSAGGGFQFNARQMTQTSCDSDTSLGKMCWSGVHDLYAAGKGVVWTALYRETQGGPDAGGIYCSTDGGRTWSCKLAKKYMQCVAGGAPGPGDVWAGQSKLTNASRANVTENAGLLRSSDGGKEWKSVDLGIGISAVHRLAIHGTEVWAGVPGQGVYYLDTKPR